jgi:rhodanese-related sulfurtransferase
MFFSNLFKSKSSVENISATALKQLLKQDKSLKLVDVRTPNEFKQGHIKNAVNIDVFKSDFVNQCESKFKTSDRLIIYCRSGQRSMNAAKKLEKAGFTSLYNLNGGVMAWSRA